MAEFSKTGNYSKIALFFKK